MTSKMWNKIGKIVHKCESEHEAGVKFMNDFKRSQLIDGITQGEEQRLRR